MARAQKKLEPVTLAGVLQKARRVAGLTPVALCLKSGVSVPVIYSIERGATPKPNIATLKKLIVALELRAEELAPLAGYKPEELVDQVVAQ